MAFYILRGHRVCLVDGGDLISSLYSWWEGFGSSSLASLPRGFYCGFSSTSACGPCTGVQPLRLPWRGRCGCGAAAQLAGTLVGPSVQGHKLPPRQELWPYQSLFSSLSQLAIRRALWPAFLHSSAHLGTQGSLAWGPFLLFSAPDTWREPPDWGPVLQIGVSVT